MARPIVSVIIPTHNRPTSLPRAIQSALDQTFYDLEIIVVDDASEPPLDSILEKYDDPRIRYIRLPQRRGASASRNMGIKAARGQFISFLDDDDRYQKKKIEKQLQVFERCSYSVGLVYCGHIYRHDDGQIMFVNVPRKSRWENLFHNSLIGAAVLVRKQCFEDVGLFDEGLTYYEDADMWYRVSQEYDFDLCREALYEVIAHPRSSSTQDLCDRLESLNRYYGKHGKKYELLSKRVQDRVLSTYHWQRALAFNHFNRTEEMRNEALKSISYYPFSSRRWRLLIYSLIDERRRHMLRSLYRKVMRNPSV